MVTLEVIHLNLLLHFKDTEDFEGGEKVTYAKAEIFMNGDFLFIVVCLYCP